MNIYPPVFEAKLRKIGDAKIFHFTVSCLFFLFENYKTLSSLCIDPTRSEFQKMGFHMMKFKYKYCRSFGDFDQNELQPVHSFADLKKLNTCKLVKIS